MSLKEKDLVLKEETAKITISLTKSSIDFLRVRLQRITLTTRQ